MKPGWTNAFGCQGTTCDVLEVKWSLKVHIAYSIYREKWSHIRLEYGCKKKRKTRRKSVWKINTVPSQILMERHLINFIESFSWKCLCKRGQVHDKCFHCAHYSLQLQRHVIILSFPFLSLPSTPQHTSTLRSKYKVPFTQREKSFTWFSLLVTRYFLHTYVASSLLHSHSHQMIQLLSHACAHYYLHEAFICSLYLPSFSLLLR